MQTTTVPIPITTALILRGQRAWTRIKTTAAEQRELWRQVGEALAYGRAENPSTKAFGAWVIEHGFGDMDRFTRRDALWLADNWHALTGNDSPSATHPTAVRIAHRKALRSASPAPTKDTEFSEHEAAADAPKVITYDNVVAERRESIATFARKALEQMNDLCRRQRIDPAAGSSGSRRAALV